MYCVHKLSNRILRAVRIFRGLIEIVVWYAELLEGSGCMYVRYVHMFTRYV